MSASKTSITAENLNQLIGTPDCPTIIDVRRKKAFDDSDQIIAAAEWIDHEKAADQASKLTGAAIVYCVHGHEVSQNAATALRYEGIDAVFLEGGIEGFIEAGFETDKK